jgi:hypothetical protein
VAASRLAAFGPGFLGATEAGADALLDHGALELGEHPHHLKHRFAGWRRGVEALLVQVEVDLERVDLIYVSEGSGPDKPALAAGAVLCCSAWPPLSTMKTTRPKISNPTSPSSAMPQHAATTRAPTPFAITALVGAGFGFGGALGSSSRCQIPMDLEVRRKAQQMQRSR